MLDDIDILDAAGATRSVGTVLNGTVHDATGVPIAGEVEEVTGVTLSNTPTVITIEPQTTWLLLDLGQDAPSGTTGVTMTGTFTSGGDGIPLDFWPMIANRGMGRRVLARWNTLWTTLRAADDATEGDRVWIVPVAGVKTVTLTLISAHTLANVAYRQMAGPPPNPFQPTTVVQDVYGEVDVTATPYADGDSIGGDADLSGPDVSIWNRLTSPVLTQLKVGDYNGELLDFDIILSPHGFNGGQVDNSPFDLPYPEGVVAWFECRTTPTAGQYPIRSAGSGGGQIVLIDGIRVPTVATSEAIAAGRIGWWDMHFVARGAVTFTADTIYVEGVAELS